MKQLLLILTACALLLGASQERGVIDMHGGKTQKYGGFSKKFEDSNSNRFGKFKEQSKSYKQDKYPSK
ncbi:hypothetical protein [Campylobacter sp. RM16192]|uniref:hypothetical protein n=1 Tax=Campylobacter sp. RM16192 TaxID=1660080 RepID=UPI0014510DA5|nr:hypothetical protein [Campylobacter sp. RM16192]QCD52983.1 hypothetical protein CDOMC_1378 [Campylobacter sp. RM16192]